MYASAMPVPCQCPGSAAGGRVERRRARMRQPGGRMAPRNSESVQTPELLTDTGDRHTLTWCHDERHWCLRTSSGKALWAVPYPQGLNDIPMLVEPQLDAKDFAQTIIDGFDEMLDRSCGRLRVMGIA